MLSWYGWVAILAAGVLLLGTAAAEEASSDSVKTAFLYNFAKLVTWPPNDRHASGQPFVFCLRQGALGPTALSSLEGKTAQNRPVKLLPFQGTPPSSCNIAYLSRPAADEEVQALIEHGRGRPLLLVSDLPNFAQAGGHIGLFEEGGRIRFNINIAAVRGSSLVMSSKLLQLAVLLVGE